MYELSHSRLLLTSQNAKTYTERYSVKYRPSKLKLMKQIKNQHKEKPIV